MKKIVLILAALMTIHSKLAIAQSPTKQYCGGTKGSVSNPSNALGSDLSDFSTLKLRTPNEKRDHVYQNFVFDPAATKGTRVAFVVQADHTFDPTQKIELNLKFYVSNETYTDTLNKEELQITQLNANLNLYEFSFSTNQHFDTAGMMLHGGGIFKSIKIYKVYLAINHSNTNTNRFVSAKK
jgi:hypothetical protein